MCLLDFYERNNFLYVFVGFYERDNFLYVFVEFCERDNFSVICWMCGDGQNQFSVPVCCM